MATYYLDPTAGSNGDGSQGSPFNSLANVLSGIITAFNSATEDYVVNCLAGDDTSDGDVALIAINTTSSTARTLRFIASGSDRHTGVRGTGYRYQNRIQSNNDNANVTLELVGISFAGFIQDRAANPPATLTSCAMFDSAARGIYSGGGTITVKNCVIVGATNEGVQCEDNNGQGVVNLVNCTIAESGAQGVLSQFGGATTAINCYSGNNVGADYSGLSSLTNCLSEDGTQSTTTAAYTTSNFTTVTAGSENLKLPSGSALIDAGVGPGSNGNVPNDDFEGTARSGSTTDVGFDQRAAAGGSVNTQTLSDNLSVDDAALDYVFATRLASDSIELTDGPLESFAIHNLNSISETTITDDLVVWMRRHRLVESNIVAEDQLLRALLVERALLDEIEVSDSALTSIQRFILLTDTILLEDSLLSTYVPANTVNPLIRIGFDQPEVKLGGYSVN